MNAKQRRVARREEEREDALMRPAVMAALAELRSERAAHPDRPVRDWREVLQEMTSTAAPAPG